MEVYVAAALKQPGEVFHASLEQNFAAENFGGRSIVFTKPVHLQFSYSFDGKALALHGQMDFVLSTYCARCNEPCEERVRIPFEEQFVKGTMDIDSDDYAFDGDTLVLDSMILDTLFLNLPMQSICKNSCKGLCPICGTNLNNTQCDCGASQADETHKPLSALHALLSDDKEV